MARLITQSRVNRPGGRQPFTRQTAHAGHAALHPSASAGGIDSGITAGAITRRRLTHYGPAAGMCQRSVGQHGDGADLGDNADKTEITHGPPIFLGVAGPLRQVV
ncbi:hypothetical protein [Sodalis sp. (in: enterobacteria)]|uniref:hypothetical protein n=1 Tax=Sodalis sp. (in: enterobacteria) TaxID=1898979 RepID=UPI0039E3BB4C